jgi:hypothetical protein
MSIVLMPISESEYVPNYLFLYGDDQAGPCKNRHVMKECEASSLSLATLLTVG